MLLEQRRRELARHQPLAVGRGFQQLQSRTSACRLAGPKGKA